MRTNNQYEYDLITENDREVQEPEETKEYIAEYYENLYQAREGKDKYKDHLTILKESKRKHSNTEKEETTSIYGIHRCHKSIRQSMARRTTICTKQKRNRNRKLADNK